MFFQVSKPLGKAIGASKLQIVNLKETGDDQPDSEASLDHPPTKTKAKKVRKVISTVKVISVDNTKKPQPSTSKKGKKNRSKLLNLTHVPLKRLLRVSLKMLLKLSAKVLILAPTLKLPR